MTTARQTALITGATSGIGLELAKVFAKNNFDLLLIARDQENLNRISSDLKNQYSINTATLAKDLAKENSAKEIFDFCNSSKINVSVLVNNAGFGAYGEFHTQELQTQTGMVELNIKSLTSLCRLFIPEMLKQKHGKILNVASTAAFLPGPFFAVYYATKAYVLSLSEALSSELEGTNITVTCLCPGPTKTDFFKTDSNINKTKLIKNGSLMSAQKVAEVGFKGLMSGNAIIIPGFINKFLAFWSQILPRAIIRTISRWTLQP